MLRLAGALCISGAAMAAGMSAAGMLRARVIQLEAFAALISHIASQVESFRAPLDAIFAEYESAVLAKCGFLAALRAHGGSEALRISAARLYLTRAETAERARFFGGLGRHGAAEEARHIAYYEARIGAMAQTARSEFAARARLCRALGALAGVMLAVLLL